MLFQNQESQNSKEVNEMKKDPRMKKILEKITSYQYETSDIIPLQKYKVQEVEGNFYREKSLQKIKSYRNKLIKTQNPENDDLTNLEKLAYSTCNKIEKKYAKYIKKVKKDMKFLKNNENKIC